MELAITSTSMKLRDRAPVVFRGEDNWCFEQIRSIGYDGVELHIHDSSQLDRKQLKEELDQFWPEFDFDWNRICLWKRQGVFIQRRCGCKTGCN